MSIRDFAEHLGVSERTVSKWEAGRAAVRPRPEIQAALDTALGMAPPDAALRFASVVGSKESPRETFADSYRVESHKFIPAFVGTKAAQAFAFSCQSQLHEWLDVSSTQIPHANGACTAYVFRCGVVVLHLRQDLDLTRLATLAAWRYATYESDLPWATEYLRQTLPLDAAWQPPEYVLSMYLLRNTMWAGEELDNALRLMSLPSVLVNRQARPEPEPVGTHVERRLLVQGFDQPAVEPFGVAGVSVGYASWSGLAYYPLSPERALMPDDLVSFEIDVQMLWAYCRHIQREVEAGRDPLMPQPYGWRFLRAAHSRLTTARAQETAQHCMMREAALTTSGLPERLAQAQAALRETEGQSGRVFA
ncbi:helix-turn-helix transcriptional regulator [Micromonospora sp. MMS20-R2-23]|uniref:Helix-turn-helix transcriptional regulator n=2 Tax=Micromonospora antibiotica TaxID=2807623 RepID=A0ABS3VC01_9ACTN|nr:helix-turn-helix transcriptional regulator [Micromonospora antibiotica]